MPNLTSVTVTAGIPTAGTGTVSTLDNLLGTAGSPSANVQSVQGVASGTTLKVGGLVTNPSANFTRPADTTAYASGDLVANSTTAGSVTALSFTPTATSAGSFVIRRLKLHTSSTSVTNASFRLHLFTAAPGTITNGDNGAFSVSAVANYVDCIDVTLDRAFTDGAAGTAATDIAVKLASGTTLYGLLEARAAYTPTSAGVFTCTLDVLND